MNFQLESRNKNWFPLLSGRSDNVSLTLQVAQKAASLMWGRGFHIESSNDSDKEIINKILDHNNFQELMYTAETDLSQHGNLIATVEVVNGMPTVILSDPFLIQRIGVSYVEKELAVVWKRITIDNASYPIMETWDREKVTRQMFSEEGRTISVSNQTKMLEGKIPSVWYHNLGYVPVVWMKNRSGAHRMYSIPDNYGSGNLEDNYNKTLKILHDIEIENNITRIYANLNKKDAKTLKLEARKLGVSVATLLKQSSTIVETDFSGDKSGDKTNMGAQVIQGNPKFNEYWHGLEMLKGEFFNTCGYSYTKPTEQGDSRNTTDVIFSNAKDIETTKAKLLVRQTHLKELINICKDMMNAHGIGSIDGELSVDIRSNIMSDSIAEVEKSKIKLEMGLSSRAHEIAKIEGISLEEAEEKLVYIEEENNKYKIEEEGSETSKDGSKNGEE